MRSISPSSGHDDPRLRFEGERERHRRSLHHAVGADPGEHRVLRIRADCDERGCEAPLQRRGSVVESHDAQGPVGRERCVVRAVLVEQQRLRHGARDGRGPGEFHAGGAQHRRDLEEQEGEDPRDAQDHREAADADRETGSAVDGDQSDPPGSGRAVRFESGDRHRSRQLAALLVDRPGERQIAVLTTISWPSRAPGGRTPDERIERGRAPIHRPSGSARAILARVDVGGFAPRTRTVLAARSTASRLTSSDALSRRRVSRRPPPTPNRCSRRRGSPAAERARSSRSAC
jgi:hypothetical protein